MIKKIGEIMLYVNNQEESLKFWTEKAGFTLIDEQDNGQGFKYMEIAPMKDAHTTIILQNKQWVAEHSPELNLGTPSLMFFADNVEALYKDYKDKNITVGELVEMPFGKVFNFADNEGNYFAVMENK